MGNFDKHYIYDYDTLANDADYLDDEYDDDEYEDVQEDIISWENYYHNIADEIVDE